MDADDIADDWYCGEHSDCIHHTFSSQSDGSPAYQPMERSRGKTKPPAADLSDGSSSPIQQPQHKGNAETKAPASELPPPPTATYQYPEQIQSSPQVEKASKRLEPEVDETVSHPESKLATVEDEVVVEDPSVPNTGDDVAAPPPAANEQLSEQDSLIPVVGIKPKKRKLSEVEYPVSPPAPKRRRLSPIADEVTKDSSSPNAGVDAGAPLPKGEVELTEKGELSPAVVLKPKRTLPEVGEPVSSPDAKRRKLSPIVDEVTNDSSSLNAGVDAGAPLPKGEVELPEKAEFGPVVGLKSKRTLPEVDEPVSSPEAKRRKLSATEHKLTITKDPSSPDGELDVTAPPLNGGVELLQQPLSSVVLEESMQFSPLAVPPPNGGVELLQQPPSSVALKKSKRSRSGVDDPVAGPEAKRRRLSTEEDKVAIVEDADQSKAELEVPKKRQLRPRVEKELKRSGSAVDEPVSNPEPKRRKAPTNRKQAKIVEDSALSGDQLPQKRELRPRAAKDAKRSRSEIEQPVSRPEPNRRGLPTTRNTAVIIDDPSQFDVPAGVTRSLRPRREWANTCRK